MRKISDNLFASQKLRRRTTRMVFTKPLLLLLFAKLEHRHGLSINWKSNLHLITKLVVWQFNFVLELAVIFLSIEKSLCVHSRWLIEHSFCICSYQRPETLTSHQGSISDQKLIDIDRRIIFIMKLCWTYTSFQRTGILKR